MWASLLIVKQMCSSTTQASIDAASVAMDFPEKDLSSFLQAVKSKIELDRSDFLPAVEEVTKDQLQLLVELNDHLKEDYKQRRCGECCET